MKIPPAPYTDDPQLSPLLANLIKLIHAARQQALRSVDAIQVLTCWQVGRHIVEFEQQGSTRAKYGKKLLPTLANELTGHYGKGFDAQIFDTCGAFFLHSQNTTRCVAN